MPLTILIQRGVISIKVIKDLIIYFKYVKYISEHKNNAKNVKIQNYFVQKSDIIEKHKLQFWNWQKNTVKLI